MQVKFRCKIEGINALSADFLLILLTHQESRNLIFHLELYDMHITSSMVSPNLIHTKHVDDGIPAIVKKCAAELGHFLQPLQ